MKKQDSKVTIQQLKEIIQQFVAERDWQQYHNPKNISISIAIEAAELMEKFQFLSSQESIDAIADNKKEISHELADVLCYVLSFANVCDIDLSSIVEEKMALNRKRYPADRVKGSLSEYQKIRNGK